MKTLREERRSIQRDITSQAQEQRQRVEVAARQAESALRKQHGEVERQLQKSLGEARKVEKVEQRKVDLPITKPRDTGIKEKIAALETWSGEATSAIGKAKVELEEAKSKDLAAVEKATKEAEATLDKAYKEALKSQEELEDYEKSLEVVEVDIKAPRKSMLAESGGDDALYLERLKQERKEALDKLKDFKVIVRPPRGAGAGAKFAAIAQVPGYDLAKAMDADIPDRTLLLAGFTQKIIDKVKEIRVKLEPYIVEGGYDIRKALRLGVNPEFLIEAGFDKDIVNKFVDLMGKFEDVVTLSTTPETESQSWYERLMEGLPPGLADLAGVMAVATPVVAVTPFPHDDAVLWAIRGALVIIAAYQASQIIGNIDVDLENTSKITLTKLKDIVQGIPLERPDLISTIREFPLDKPWTAEELIAKFPYMKGKLEDFIWKFPLDPPEMKGYIEGVPLIARKMEDIIFTSSAAVAEAGSEVVNATGAFLDSIEVRNSIEAWQNSLDAGVSSGIREALANVNNAIEIAYHRGYSTLEGVSASASEFNALERARAVWQRASAAFTSKLEGLDTSVAELVDTLSPEHIPTEELQNSLSTYVAGLLSILYAIPKPRSDDTTATEHLIQTIVTPSVLTESVVQAAKLAATEAMAEGKSKLDTDLAINTAVETIIQTITNPQVQTAVRSHSLPIVKTFLQSLTQTAVKTPTKTTTKTKKKWPTFIPPLPGGGAHTPTTIKKLKEGTICWKQGIWWKIIPPPYSILKPISSKTPPSGVVRLKGTPQQTLTFIGGVIPFKDVSFDLGVVDGFIDVKTKTINFTGKGMKTDVGSRIPDSGQGLSIPAQSDTPPSREKFLKIITVMSTPMIAWYLTRFDVRTQNRLIGYLNPTARIQVYKELESFSSEFHPELEFDEEKRERLRRPTKKRHVGLRPPRLQPPSLKGVRL